MIITNSRYALVGYFTTSYPTQAHGIIVIDKEPISRASSFMNVYLNVEKKREIFTELPLIFSKTSLNLCESLTVSDVSDRKPVQRVKPISGE